VLDDGFSLHPKHAGGKTKKKKNSVVLAVCTFPYTGTNSINSSLINGKINGKVIPVISEV
jgi:hypothetical protein